MNGWSPKGFGEVWRSAVADHGSRSFLVYEAPDGSVTSWTYEAFGEVVDEVALDLAERGVESGDAVHLALRNGPPFVAIWLACMQLGAWIVPSDPMAKTPELLDQMSRTRPVVGFCEHDRRCEYLGASTELVMSTVVIAETSSEFGWLGVRVGDSSERLAPVPVEPTARAAVMFTSGTTGQPKGVEVTQANYAFAGHTMAKASSLTHDDRQIVVLPLFHANAQYYSFASAICVGASVALIHHFSASGFLGQCARHGATAASLFAAPIRMILARGDAADAVTLRHCWFAQNIAEDQYEQISAMLGCRPRQLYGMTETIPAVLTEDSAAPRADMMGYVTEGCEVDLQDASGRSVTPGEVGEIVVRGEPGLTLFAGYLDAPEITRDSYRDGWFRTGDRATRSSDGRYAFDGRRSDVLKVAGENVSTVEVEAVLSAHPGVLEASVIGAPDEIRDEVPVAFIVTSDDGNPPSTEVLIEWCRKRLAPAKVPRDIVQLDELPRTSVGKIRKFKLRELVDA